MCHFCLLENCLHNIEENLSNQNYCVTNLLCKFHSAASESNQNDIFSNMFEILLKSP